MASFSPVAMASFSNVADTPSGPDHAGLDREVLRSSDRGLALLRSVGVGLIASGLATVCDRTSSARGEVGREKYCDRALRRCSVETRADRE